MHALMSLRWPAKAHKSAYLASSSMIQIKSKQRDKPDQIAEKHALVCLFRNYGSLSQS